MSESRLSGTARRLPTKLRFSQLSGERNSSRAARAQPACLLKQPKPNSDFMRNPADRLLKWFNSLYRPALPEGSADQPVRRFPDGLLGRRQVVRQGILIPP